MPTAPPSPDCRAGKHAACSGDSWDRTSDAHVPVPLPVPRDRPVTAARPLPMQEVPWIPPEGGTYDRALAAVLATTPTIPPRPRRRAAR